MTLFIAALRNIRIGVLLVLFLFAFALPINAQTSTAQFPTQSVADSIRQVGVEDTTYAVQRLFHKQRRLNRSRAILWGVGLGFYGTVAAVRTYPKGSAFDKVAVTAAAGTMAVLLTRALVRGHSYRAGRERKILAALERGQPLPPRVRAKLSPNDFDSTTTTSP